MLTRNTDTMDTFFIRESYFGGSESLIVNHPNKAFR
jgi:hypothetical protein